jgi:N-acetylneuraminic acid mutarotase
VRRSRNKYLLPLGIIAALLIALPVLALTEFGVETDVKDALGLVDRCIPDEVESEGWRAESDLPDDRDEPRAVALGGQIYIAGGQSELLDYGDPSEVPGVKERVEVRLIDALTRFDPESGTYTELAPMPVPVNHQSMVAYGGDVYAVGGHGRFLFGGSPKRAFQRYETDAGRWSRMPPMPTARGAAAAGVIGHRLYVAGGQGENGEILPTLEIYDFETGEWSRGPDMPSRREHVGAAVSGGQLYVLGGRTETADAVATAQRYDPERQEWEELAPMPMPTGGLEAFSFEGTPLAVGGGDDRAGTVTGAVQRLDPATGEWTELPRMRIARHGYAGAIVDGRLYVFGGSLCAGFSASKEADSFDLSTSPAA